MSLRNARCNSKETQAPFAISSLEVTVRNAQSVTG